MKTSDIVLLFAAVAAFPVLFVNVALGASMFFALGVGSLLFADYAPRLEVARAHVTISGRRLERLSLAA
ncbi:MAG TPA: hypothetical protein VHO24_13095 [Opitutaceae bacterium]|nr:hypothetical protein [Opitutaceae bacterium]